jgi:PIN domain nuclease of toxin-antitoxin system
MRLLLDTHVVLWMFANDPRLSRGAWEAIASAEEAYWSVATLWEIGIKQGRGRPDFRLEPGWEKSIPEHLKKNDFQRLNIETRHCAEISSLPLHHKDPFDRMLIAQAKTEDLILITADSKIANYPIKTLW